MSEGQVRSRYLLHTFLHKFTESLFFAFGALLIYAKTGSILATLVYGAVGSLASGLAKSLGFGFIEKMFRNWGLMGSMTIGLLMKVAALVGIFYIDPQISNFYTALFSLHVLENVGNALYVIGANAIMFEVVGRSRHPGHSSAQINSLQIVSGLLAAGTGVFLNSQGSFLSSFLLGGAVLLGSTLPLLGLPTPRVPALSFRKNLKQVSWSMLLANINPDHKIHTTGLPLVILAVSASLDLSIWITAGITAITIFAAHLAGWVKDHHGAWLTWLALAIGIIAWGFYGFAASAAGFLIPSIFVGLATQIIGVGRKSRMSKELEDADNILGGTLAIEFARSIGGFIGSGVLILGYLAAGGIPQLLLVIGGIFLIPEAIYAAGGPRKPQARRQMVELSP